MREKHKNLYSAARCIAEMAYIARCGVGIFAIKQVKNVSPRIFLPSKNQRLLFHTSWVLDGKYCPIEIYFLRPWFQVTQVRVAH